MFFDNTRLAGDLGKIKWLFSPLPFVSNGVRILFFRLKFLLRKAMNEEVNKEELIAHLGYVVNVLDSTFSDDSKSVNIACCS